MGVNAPITPTAPAHPLEWLQERLVALAVACPFAENNPPNCPLHHLRTLSSREILDWLEGLSADEAQFMLRYHECCLATQLESQLFGRRPVRPPCRKMRGAPHG